MIFIDRSIPRRAGDAITLVRDDVLVLEDRFLADTPDPAWLAHAGDHDWMVVTRDRRIRSRANQVQAILDHRVGAFILTMPGHPRPWDFLKVLAATLDTMTAVYDRQTRPFVFGVSGDGTSRRMKLRCCCGAAVSVPSSV